MTYPLIAGKDADEVVHNARSCCSCTLSLSGFVESVSDPLAKNGLTGRQHASARSRMPLKRREWGVSTHFMAHGLIAVLENSLSER